MRDDLEFTDKGFSGLPKSGPVWRSPLAPFGRRSRSVNWKLDKTIWQKALAAPALAILDASLHIPVAGEIFRRCEADLFGCLTMIPAAQISRALPETTVLSTVNVKRSVHQNMGLKNHTKNSTLCKTCVSLFRCLVYL